jgi:hypothetical protein
MLRNFLPFISLFTGGDVDAPISMAAMLNRLKLASHVICWTKVRGFAQPVHAYLKRKLRHVMSKVAFRSSASSALTPAPTLLLVTGHEYYSWMGERNATGQPIYYPARLVYFKVLPQTASVEMYLETLDDSGQKLAYTWVSCKTAHMKTSFVPKAEFEANPLGQVIRTKRQTIDSHHYSPPPTDWSTYDSDMNEILSCLAPRCPAFTLPSSLLPSTGTSAPYQMSNGSCSLHFTQIDHGMSFQPFFSDKTSACDQQQRDKLLQKAALCEVNRCFFIHLGVALGLHPIALQAIFRAHSSALLRRINVALSEKTHEDDQRFDGLKMWDSSLQSVLARNDMIEAAVLGILWPMELQNVRVLIFTVGHTGPQPNACYLFSPHASADDGDSFNGIDVILKLQGMHFTLLRPQDEHAAQSPIDQILDLFPEITEAQPLHLQASDAGSMVREVGRVPSLADLHTAHSPAPPSPPPMPQPSLHPEPYD